MTKQDAIEQDRSEAISAAETVEVSNQDAPKAEEKAEAVALDGQEVFDDTDDDDDFSEIVEETSRGAVQTGGEYAQDGEYVQSSSQRVIMPKKSPMRLTLPRTLLMLGVLGFVPYYLYGDRQDLAYFFSDGEPVSLGAAEDYRLVEGEASKSQDFPDNRYVSIRGIPIRHVGIRERSNIASHAVKIVYQLMGSSVYVGENAEDSQFASFVSQTSTTFGANVGVEPLNITGRLRRFDTSDTKQLTPIRDYYTEKYGTVFCADMSESERKRKAGLLGKGGVSVQIMPDGSVIQAQTDTHVTLIDVEPLRGRAAMALGKNNRLLHSIDAGLTWRNAELPVSQQVGAIAYQPQTDQIVFAGAKGWVGNEKGALIPDALTLTQDITDLVFTRLEPDDTTSPRLIAVGKEGLLLVANPDQEGMVPASIDDGLRFNDVLQVEGTLFAAGSQDLLMHRPVGEDVAQPWTKSVSPVRATWLGLSAMPGGVVATGTDGAVARFEFGNAAQTWSLWQVDDVPGIDFESDIRASAVSDDGKTWVGVGDEGAILVAKKDDNGEFGRIQRISGTYAGYGVVRDILAGNTVEQSLYEALQRHTQETLYDVTYHNGMFYAVGSESLLMTSRDGLSWQKRELHVKHRTLRAVRFTSDGIGFIGGEKGVMFETRDDGKTWKGKLSPTQRSIYKIRTSPAFEKGFIFSGAYGLWGFCLTQDDKCYLRSRNDDRHYRSIEFGAGQQKSGYLHVVAVGDEGRLDQIDDAPNDQAKKTSLWIRQSSAVRDMAVAEEPLPLQPNAPRGHLALVAAANGAIFRSYDGGYTFRREETGLTAPIHRLLMTPDGSVVWALDEQGFVIEDRDGRRLWKRLVPEEKKRFLDGAFVGNTGYLIDRQCIYRRALQNDSSLETIACLKNPSASLSSLAADGKTLRFAYHSPDAQTGLSLASLDTTAPVDAAQPVDIDGLNVIDMPNVPSGAQIVACQNQIAVFDAQNHTLYAANGETIPHVADVRCMGGKMTRLQTQPVEQHPGLHRMAAWQDTELWHVNVGFDPTQARFVQSANNGRWWVGAEAKNAEVPFILMSDNGTEWSWRRERITDFHAVAQAGAHAVAVGDNGTILVSENTGKSWAPVKISSRKTFRDVCLSSDGMFAVAVGDEGTVYRAQNNLMNWTRLKYKLDLDLTACAIVEQKDRFQIYLSGKGGAIYTSPEDTLGKLELIPSPAVEDIYSMTALETGEVIAVGGVYQDPATLCEKGFLIDANKKPRDMWPSILFALLMILAWGWTLKLFIVGLKHRNDKEFEEIDSDMNKIL